MDAEKQDGCIRFSVTDEGIGIPKESFNMFYRGYLDGKRNSDAGGVKGNGLGLAVCKAVLDSYKGHIWVESEIGKGSSFSSTIPTVRRRDVKAVKPGKRASIVRSRSTRDGTGVKNSAKASNSRKVPSPR